MHEMAIVAAKALVEATDVLLRVPFWLFLDLLLASRLDGIYDFISRHPKEMKRVCPDCQVLFDDRFVPFIIAGCCILCFVVISFHTVGVIVAYGVTLGAAIIWVGLGVYVGMLRMAYSPWDRMNMDSLVGIHLTIAFFVGLVALVVLCVLAFPKLVPFRYCVLVAFATAAVPLLSYLPVRYLAETGPVTQSCHVTPGSLSPFACTTPAWHAYALAILRFRHCETGLLPFDICTLIDTRYALQVSNHLCPATRKHFCSGTLCSSNLRDAVYTLAPFCLLVLYLIFILVCVHVSSVFKRFLTSVKEEVELFNVVGIFGFINFHWNRLNIPLTMASLWCFKLILVTLFGPKWWPVLPGQQGQLLSNISFLQDFTLSDSNQTKLSSVISRVYVGAVVHGSETWLVVFGAAAFFGAVAILFVRFLVFLLDPSGEETARLFEAAGDAPIDLHEWNVIEDPTLAIDQNDVIAAEMLAATGWNCAIVFLFLAFQYDLPSLPLIQRIRCSLYGLIVIAITCIHPVQALLKSILLRLGVPGRDSPWLAHIRPLCFCVGLIAASLCVLTRAPEALAERVRDQSSNQSLSNVSSTLVPRFGSSVESLKARQLRIVLCGCQLLLGLSVTLIEYVLYQISSRNPGWQGLGSSLFWTKLVSSVLDYMISLLSFLTVCWLSIYDSIGFCRLFIICCYFYFILYPSAVRAYTWVRWRLLSMKRIHSLANPTEADLLAHGDVCPICYADMTTETAKVTRCGHLYHTDCLSTWMRRQLFCPICHADLLSTKVINSRQANQGNAVHN
ncbi:hypothetical protein EG68_11948 [Paragonimus skrjabini miyazakii]|uniref:RING-type domain-containing protein n=1 Tax=Paragonimus skrjabini miyazakii TaxID=59628 RepID=A0A8S9YC73_9TREM|nr:hypothetical protein EG68_11948 [Paragonimus skrjabini miyazakii]